MTSKQLLLLGVVSLLGCGPSNPAVEKALPAPVVSNSIEGTVDGINLVPKDAIFLKTNNQRDIVFVMSDTENLCANLKANRLPKNQTLLTIYLDRRNGDDEQVAADVGEYTVGSSSKSLQFLALAYVTTSDSKCAPTGLWDNRFGQSGLVKVQELSAKPNGRMTGTFDITFGTQKDKTKGSFSATFCDIPSDMTPSCE